MTENLCKNCKHWQHNTAVFSFYEKLGVRKCERVSTFWDATKCNEDGNFVFTSKASEHKAFVQDGSGYFTELLTLGDFGCVQFTERLANRNLDRE